MEGFWSHNKWNLRILEQFSSNSNEEGRAHDIAKQQLMTYHAESAEF